MIFGSSQTAASTLFRSITKRHGESRILQTHPLHLFRIIQDVDRYQDFLPLCKSSRVFPETIQDHGRQFEAKLRVGKPPLLSEEYVSRVTVIPEQLRIETTSISSSQSMFDSLRSSWQLKRVDGDEEEDDDIIGEAGGSAIDSRNDNPQSSAYQNIRCHVDFEVQMTVSNPAVMAILDQVLMQVAGHQVEAFDKRCQELDWPMELIRQAERGGRIL